MRLAIPARMELTPGTSIQSLLGIKASFNSLVVLHYHRPYQGYHRYSPQSEMGYRDRVVGCLVVCVLTVGFLGENGHAFTPSPRVTISRTQPAVKPRSLGVHSTVLHAKKSDQPRFHLFRRNRQIRQRKDAQPRRGGIMNRFRRAIAIMWTAALLWFGGAQLQVPPAFASSTTVSSSESVLSRVIPKGASLDQIVDKYVKAHMFDDDVYDPLESTYIESYDDATTGKYPRALNEVASSLLGSDVTTKTEKASSENMFISLLSNGSSALQKLGLSSTLATVIVYATTLVGVPSMVLIGILSYANAQKRMRIRQNRKRYGEDYR